MAELAKSVATVSDLLKRMAPQFAMVAPKHLDIDRLIRLALNQYQRTPKLRECTESSFIGCLMSCAQVGLHPDSVGQKAHLIPRKIKGVMTCTIVFGFKGLSDLARRSPDVRDILPPQVVYENDEFSRTLGQNPTLTHIPTEGERGAIRGFYAVGVLASGERPFSYLTDQEVQAVKTRATAQMGGTGPWFTDYPAMGMKTGILRLCKYLPCSDEVQMAIGLDERAEAGLDQNIDIFDVDGVSQPAVPQSNEDLRASMSTKPEPAEPPAAKPKPEPPLPPANETTTKSEPPITESEIQASDKRHEMRDEIMKLGKVLGDSKMKEILKNNESGILKLRQCDDPNKLSGILAECKVAIQTKEEAGAVA